MNVAVLGLWHLGTVTAACLASRDCDVTAIDFDPAVVAGLSAGRPPVFEPGLEPLLAEGLASGKLRVSSEPSAVANAAIVWVAYDTPVDDEDRADVAFVERAITRVFPFLADGAVVLVSSQMPVGTTRRLSHAFAAVAAGRRVGFAYSPENLRLGKAIDVFLHPDRVVVGVERDDDRRIIGQLLAPITDRIEWMGLESAEMVKHALNAFLATSVTFINEVAAVAEQVGADATDVERGLKSEARIGPKAYLSPGGAFAGGTLARDVMFLTGLGREHGVETHLLGAVKTSNDAHRGWAARRLTQCLGTLAGHTVAIWGLTYKPGTDTLRRSSAVELCRWLAAAGARVSAHDPAVTALPPDLSAIMHLASSPIEAVDGASALVVATPWPDYRQVPVEALARMTRPLVLDANRFLQHTIGVAPGVEYLAVGVGGAHT